MREDSLGFTGRLAGAAFRFETDAPDLAAYAQAHLAPLAVRGGATLAVHARLRWHDGQPPSRRPSDPSEVAGMERVDRDVYASGERLCWFRVDDLRDLFLRFTWMDDRLAVQGDFYHRLGNSALSDRARRVRRWSQGRAFRERRFTTLLSYLVYYPCWWWLEQTRDLHPIHAAAVSTDAGAILLAGASGVGKSTLAVALALSAGARLLSDSFVLHNGLDLCAVPEPILLDAWSQRWLGQHSDAFQAVDHRFGLNRRGYHLPLHRLADEGRAALLLFPRRTPATYVRRLSSEQARRRLSAADLIVNDLRRYWAFAAVMEQMAAGGLVAQREAHIARLASGVPCYELGITAETTSAEVVESILQLIRDKQLRVAGSRQ